MLCDTNGGMLPSQMGDVVTAASAIGRAPSYDSRLIESLKHDHHSLVELFQQIGQTAERGRFHELPALLVAFKTGLESHVIAENVRFYNYVENSLSGDEENLLLIRSFRREMNAIARGVKAGDIIRNIAPIVGGKGGGKPDSAMGGGSDPLKVDDALASVDDFVSEKLG